MKTKKLSLVSKARAAETRRRLSLYDRAERAERTLYDAAAVEVAARKFLLQSREELKAAAAVSACERAEAVLDAARKFWGQSTAAVATAEAGLEKARDELIDYNDRRAAAQGKKK